MSVTPRGLCQAQFAVLHVALVAIFSVGLQAGDDTGAVKAYLHEHGKRSKISRLGDAGRFYRGFAPRDDQLRNLDANGGTEPGLAFDLEAVILAVEYLQPLMDIADPDSRLVDLELPVLGYSNTVVDDLDG